MGLFLLQLLRLLCLIILLSQVFCGRTLARRSLSEEIREIHIPGPDFGRPHDKPLRQSSPKGRSRYHEDYQLQPGSKRP
ncbi:hypothetical protein MKX01_001618 [Papaver californicum]|nr:hypothetical protein MKX01_001618 [Papaver californicum]